MAYLIGPKKVEWMPMANSASSMRGMAKLCVNMPCHAITRPTAPIAMMKISASFTRRMIIALSRMSASWPDRADRRKKGMMNTPEAMALNCASASSEL